tara:strand:+ start:39 stop:320 length:282 start_codon:yes stop_codon:yes gene_type:complete
MKLKFKLNQIVLALAIVVVMYWIYRRTRIELLEGGELKKSEALMYAESSDEPNPFILYGMVKKQTDDEEKQKKALTLATQKKYDELKEFLATI